MINKSYENYVTRVQNIFTDAISKDIKVRVFTYQDALIKLRQYIEEHGYMKNLSLSVDEFISGYLIVDPYEGGDEFSPFYMIGKMPLLVPYALVKLMVDESEHCCQEYIDSVLQMVYANTDHDIESLKKSVDNVIMKYMYNIIEERSEELSDFIDNCQLYGRIRHSMVDFIMVYFTNIYDITDEYLKSKLDDILTSDLFVLAGGEENGDGMRGRIIYYLYLFIIEAYMTITSNDIYKRTKSVDYNSLICAIESSYINYFNMFESLIDVANRIDMTDEIFQTLSDKMLMFSILSISPKEFLEKYITDEKSAKALLNIL